MSIRIDQIKIKPWEDSPELLAACAAKRLHIAKQDITKLLILRRSVDARKKPDVFLTYSVAVWTKMDEKKLLGRAHLKNVGPLKIQEYRIPAVLNKSADIPRPLVVGMGPAGLFAGLLLSEAGLCPIIIERGQPVEKRKADVERFFQTGVLDPESNVQFGEGGAGTFSDGKLNTGVSDREGRNRFVLETFVKHGAPEEILYEAKPHIGTDRLRGVVAKIRATIEKNGGQVLFGTKMTELLIKDGEVRGVRVEKEADRADTINAAAWAERPERGAVGNRSVNSAGGSANPWEIPSPAVILAIGHSARDTFRALYGQKIPMESKQFAMGFRIEHPQGLINMTQYGEKAAGLLGAADYKLAASAGERGVYSFCMCPGGYVVNSSSQEGLLAVNGMSNYKRESANANSAIIVSVGAGEYDLNDPMGAIDYQTRIEKKAYSLCQGKIPQQLFGDFRDRKESKGYGDFASITKGTAELASLRGIYSEEIEAAFLTGMEEFGRRIKGFDRYDAILSGVESRTSSPVRIPRDESFQSKLAGLYPCGEGAGYAGGITSACIDGMKVAEAVIARYL